MTPLPQNPSTGLKYPKKSMSWDWYEVTVNKNEDDAVEMAYDAMLKILPDAQKYDVREVKGRLSYQRALEVYAVKGLGVKAQESVVANILCDRKGQDEPEVHIITTSNVSGGMARFIRSWEPDHRVTRADVCIDVSGGEAEYDRICEKVRAVIYDRVRPIGICEIKSEIAELNDGRTLYVGKRRKGVSPAMIRIYEKGLEDTSYALGTVRVEMQIRPSKRAQKEELARLEPVETLGATAWTEEVWTALGFELVNDWRSVPKWEKAKVEAAIDHMIVQYSGTMKEYAKIYGFDALVERIKSAAGVGI